jgi:acylglycerol lipase
MQSIGYPIKSTDGKNLYFRYWRINEPKLCICIIHGIGEHSGRYEDWANNFNNIGIAVTAIDYRGHGNADGRRGHAKSLNQIYEDIDKLLEESEKHFPNAKKVLYGQSLGGNIVLNYYFIRKQNSLSGLVITSPWFKLVNPPSSTTLVVVKFLKLFFPFLSVDNGLNINYLSRDHSVVNNYKSDPLVHNKITLKLFLDAYNQGIKISNLGYRVNSPMLLMHGSKDNITSFKSSVLFARDTGKYTNFKGWEGAYHELHNDICKNEVFDFIVNWLKNNKLY